MTKPFLSIVAGYSGAGRSVALKSLEDLGFYCIDNLPYTLVDQALEFFTDNHQGLDMFAVGLDLRSPEAIQSFGAIKDQLAEKLDIDVLFLVADEQTLLRRFTTTRRKHPLLDEGGQLIAALRREKDLMDPLLNDADATLDTSQWTPHFLARQIEARYKDQSPGRKLHVTITSFGFKYGMLRPCDSMFDVRFLKNPYFEDSLRKKTGLQSEVQDYVMTDEGWDEFFTKLTEYLRFVLPKYHEEGKNYFRLGIGCTGGHHRSVTVSEKLGEVLSANCGESVLVSVHHRDIPTA